MDTRKLPIEFKEKWVAALRSGEYKQATHALCNGSGYCCLGVAAKISGCTFRVGGVVLIDGDITSGLENIPELLRGDGWNNMLVEELTTMNDHRGCSFSEIADYIEANL